MTIFELTRDSIREIEQAKFADLGVSERGDLQRLLREQIEVISPDTLVIAEEFGEWDDSRRRIDLLGLDKEANLVVIELKRTEDGGHMELQAIRYAAMVSGMTFENAVEILRNHLVKLGHETDAEAMILEHLQWTDPSEDGFAKDVRIVLASAQFSKELTTAVMWLNERGLDIQCVRLNPYRDGHRILLDVQRIIPLPEAEQYQVRIREKNQSERRASSSRWTRDRFLQDVENRVGAAGVTVAMKVFEWISPKVTNVWWGRGVRVGSLTAVVERGEMRRHWYPVFSLYSDGWLFVEGAVLRKKLACEDGAAVARLIDSLKTIEGTTAHQGNSGRITLPFLELSNAAAWQVFQVAIEQFLVHINEAYGTENASAAISVDRAHDES